jgi:hypothetical protein
LYPGGLRNPGLLVPEADAASTAPRPQGIVWMILNSYKTMHMYM